MRIRDRYMLLAVMLISLSPWFYGAYTSWSTAFEGTPAGGDSLSLGDDRIRELKENIRNRMVMEHTFGPSTRDNGHHKEGSANMWFRAPCPTADLTADPNGSASTFDSNDVGKLCGNSTDDSMAVWNGSAYEAAFGSFFNNTIGHYAAGVAPVDTYDPTKFAIRNIYNDVTLDTAGCISGGELLTTAYGSQVFGDAGAACFTTGTVNLTGRSTTSRGLIISSLKLSSATNPLGCSFALYRDAMANQVGMNMLFSSQLGTEVYYVSGLSAGSHEFAMHARETAGTDNCVVAADPEAGYLIYVDLGPEY